MKRFLGIAMVITIFSNASAQKSFSTTASERWVEQKVSVLKKQPVTVDVVIDSKQVLQDVYGFGGTFNELGWDALQDLPVENRNQIMEDLFSKKGCNFCIARTPIAASDYAMSYYSYNDVKDDYTMRNFSVSRDKYILVPYIKEALKLRPDLKLWASPWSPPAWMKINEHYSLRSTGLKNGDGHNQLDPRRATHLHTTGFNMLVGNLEAYAIYFSKYVQEYKKLGVNISMVMPQNEIAWQPSWPSCTWRPEDLAIFVGQYLGPQFAKDRLDTEIWLGTVNFANPDYIRTFLKQKDVDKYVKGIGIQWSGKQALPTILKEFPNYRYMQTENECGEGENDWSSLERSWKAMVHCFDNGVSSYLYWNMVLDETGKSAWEWPQNSLVIVDRQRQTVRYTDEYYLMKHFSHFIQPGSYLLEASAEKNVLAFRNSEEKVVVIVYNSEDSVKNFTLKIDQKVYQASLNPKSITTLTFL